MHVSTLGSFALSNYSQIHSQMAKSHDRSTLPPLCNGHLPNKLSVPMGYSSIVSGGNYWQYLVDQTQKCTERNIVDRLCFCLPIHHYGSHICGHPSRGLSSFSTAVCKDRNSGIRAHGFGSRIFRCSGGFGITSVSWQGSTCCCYITEANGPIADFGVHSSTDYQRPGLSRTCIRVWRSLELFSSR